MNIVENIRDSIVYKKQVDMLNKKGIEYKERYGYSWVRLCTKHHDYLFYVSKQNIGHVFFSRVFNKNTIQQRLVSKGSKNLTAKSWHKRDIIVYADEKITTYRDTDIGTTTNVHRVEHTGETLGYPFRRKISYNMHLEGKDRLQYRRECIELYSYNREGTRKHILDDVFCTRVYRLYLRFKGIEQRLIPNILKEEKYISGNQVLEHLRYLYQVMSSYHPYFYKQNGLSKYNKEWLRNTILNIEHNGLLEKQYKLCKVSRSKNIDSSQLEPNTKDILEWRKQQQALLDKGELWETIEY